MIDSQPIKGESMYEVLNAYLFQHRSISVPGLGTIYLETQSASVDVAERAILPPVYRFRFDKYFDAPDREFFAYIAVQQNILDYEAIKWYNEFALELRNRIKAEDRVNWDGVGVLSKDGSGNIAFESVAEPVFMAPVPAMRVNRQNAQHILLVGDQERTNTEMNEWLHEHPEGGKKAWWIAAAVMAVIALALLGWHICCNGWSIGNQTKL